jgi:hypothetical protein
MCCGKLFAKFTPEGVNLADVIPVSEEIEE